MARWAQLSAVIMVGALMLAGCAGDDSTTVRRDLVDTSPLAEFLGTPPRGELALPHLDPRERERQDQYSALVAECMTDAGFDYQAVPMRQRLGQQFLSAYALEPAEFIRQYGYGVTTITLPEFTDPNEQIRAGLDPGRQQEYDLRLWGDLAAGDGCHQRATAEVYGDPGVRETEFGQFADLLAGIDAIYRQIDQDPRLAQAHQRWAQCLTDAGYPGLSQPSDARRSVFERLPGGASSPTDPAPGPGLAEVDPGQVEQVRAYELALATADLECRRQHVDGVRRTVVLEVEGAFVNAHRDELSRYRELLGN